MPELKQKHLDFINNKPFEFAVNPNGFTEEEVIFIEKYGHWMKVLLEGELEPCSKEQEMFVTEMKSRKPLEDCLPQVQTWKRYLRREIEEKDSRGVLKAPSPTIDDDPFYSREGIKELRKGQFQTIITVHKQ